MTTSPARVRAASESTSGRPRVVVIGSGFGGLFAAQALRKAPVDVTVIGKTSHHLFQPLLYQVATGILSEGEIAPATREILRKHENTRVVLGEVTDIDLAARTVTSHVLGRDTVHPYDQLIVAAGRELGEPVVAEVGLAGAGRDDQLVVGCTVVRPRMWDVTVRAARSMSVTSPSTTRVFSCRRRISRVAGAISPSERMPVATW